ncbi:hypothetical protein [Halomicronema sp. CCY15110]|uniref:hypothetical protein n=1 Tax=Halomicronema sp. CCY15110 TaxID=2767773 RepID=UPI001950AD1C|nr:hypothetical protein [Halomicronema sp. CCY15110]
MKELALEDIQFHSLSIVDKNGRLFWLNGKLYRAISHENSALYSQLFKEGIVEELVTKGLLVDTTMTDWCVDNYELVLHHRAIPFISYPYEWCDLMFKDATLFHIEFLIELEKYSLTTTDANSLNILFDGSKPVFIDFCSITQSDEKPLWPGRTYEKFKFLFLKPLEIMTKKQADLARTLIRDSYYVSTSKLEQQHQIFDFNKKHNLNTARLKRSAFQLIRQKTPSLIRPFFKKAFLTAQKSQAPLQSASRRSFLLELQEKVSQMKLPENSIQVTDCFDKSTTSLTDKRTWTAQQIEVDRVFATYHPKTLLDTDSNQGWYAQCAALNGSKVVAFDDDENRVRNLYTQAQQNNLYIVPLLIDLTSPHFNLCNDFFVSIDERLCCEMVMCLNITQHLLLKRRLTLEKFLSRLSALSNRWVLLEFIPPADLRNFIPSHNLSALEAWERGHCYKYETFLSVLSKFFVDVTNLATYEGGRKLLLCKKNDSH